MATIWLVSIFGGFIVLALYLSNAFERIAKIEKRVDELQAKKKG
jgi:hypothetical protein